MRSIATLLTFGAMLFSANAIAAEIAGQWQGSLEMEEAKIAQMRAQAKSPEQLAAIDTAMAFFRQTAGSARQTYNLAASGKGLFINSVLGTTYRQPVTWVLVPGEGKKATLEITRPEPGTEKPVTDKFEIEWENDDSFIVPKMTENVADGAFRFHRVKGKKKKK